MANIHDINRDEWMLRGPLAKKGYDWWWHSMTAENAETGELKPFYVEFFTCNPALAEDDPVIVWNDPEAQKAGKRPSYLMVNAGFWGEDQAAEFLRKKGYFVFENDWKSGHRDIDIIAKDGDTIVFVEVKTRRNRVFTEPTAVGCSTEYGLDFSCATA